MPATATKLQPIFKIKAHKKEASKIPDGVLRAHIYAFMDLIYDSNDPKAKKVKKALPNLSNAELNKALDFVIGQFKPPPNMPDWTMTAFEADLAEINDAIKIKIMTHMRAHFREDGKPIREASQSLTPN